MANIKIERVLKKLVMPKSGAVLAVFPQLEKMLNNEAAYLVCGAEQKRVVSMPTLVSGEEVLAIGTSGYTGSAKLVLQTSEALLCSIEATKTYLGGSGQWLSALPHQYIGGLQVLLRSIVAGTTPVFLESEQFNAKSFVAACAKLSHVRCYVSLVPTQLKILLANEQACVALARFAAVLVGGAGVAESVLLQAASKNIKVVTTYGMSETCGGCVYNGQPLARVCVKTDDQNRIHVKGGVVAKSYLTSPDLLRKELGASWFCTQDLGYWDGQFLTIFGRADDVIISGGVKIATHKLAKHILANNLVKDCVVLGVPNQLWGKSLVAFVVGRESSLGVIKAGIAKNIGKYAVPKVFVDLPVIPLLESGKTDKQKLLAIFAKNYG